MTTTQGTLPFHLILAARDVRGGVGDPTRRTPYILNEIDQGTYGVNDSDQWGNSLLIACAIGEQLHSGNLLYKIWPQHVVLARALLDRGADVNHRTAISWTGLAPNASTALAVAAAGGGLASPDLVQLLLDAGADINATNAYGTPLAMAIHGFGDVPDDPPRHNACRKIVHMLLRAGAQIGTEAIDEAFEQTEGRCFRGEIGLGSPRVFQCSAESHAHYTAAKEMILGVRAAGSWRAYAKLPRKQVLTLRSLALRGRAKPRDPRMTFLVDSPNEIAWKILEYWRTELDC